MDVLLKKLTWLRTEKEKAVNDAKIIQEKAILANERAFVAKENLKLQQEKIKSLESNLLNEQDKLNQGKIEYKSKEEACAKANAHIQYLKHRIVDLEKQLVNFEAVEQSTKSYHLYSENESLYKDSLEGIRSTDSERITILELQLKNAKLIADLADKKYVSAIQKLGKMEQHLAEAENNTIKRSSKIFELERILEHISNNVSNIEVSEKRKNSIKRKCTEMSIKLHEAEARANFAEDSMTKLQSEVQRLDNYDYDDRFSMR